jgi:hypothetical protein
MLLCAFSIYSPIAELSKGWGIVEPKFYPLLLGNPGLGFAICLFFILVGLIGASFAFFGLYSKRSRACFLFCSKVSRTYCPLKG